MGGFTKEILDIAEKQVVDAGIFGVVSAKPLPAFEELCEKGRAWRHSVNGVNFRETKYIYFRKGVKGILMGEVPQ